MKIAQIMLGTGWGGIQTFFIDCCIEMSEREHDLLAVVRQDSWLYESMSRINGKFELKTVNNQFGNYDWVSIANIKGILHEFGPDIVVAHGLRSTLFCGRIKAIGNRRWTLIAPIHNLGLKQKYYKRADLLIPHTNSVADPNYHKGLVDPVLSEVIPLFRRIKAVDAIRTKRQIRNLFSVGRLTVNKGYMYLIKGTELLQSSGVDFHLTIVGDGPERENLVKLTKDLGLQNRVSFPGASKNVAESIKDADLFILPSIKEPFGLVLLEAMALGIPIVATQTNGPMEVLNESSAILVRKHSAKALFEGIEEAVSNPDVTCQRASKALTIYKECYTADVIVPRLLSLFQDCIDQRSDPNSTKSLV